MHRFLFATAAVLIAAASASAQQAAAPARLAAGAATGSGAAPAIFDGASGDPALTVVQGNALTATNGQLANSPVRLRDARLGRIVGSQTTDRSGLFEFRGVDPGTYVVELLGQDQTVLAASEMFSVDAGNTVSAIVRLPLRKPPLAGLFGKGAAEAAAVASAAAAAGVLADQVVSAPASSTVTDISPR